MSKPLNLCSKLFRIFSSEQGIEYDKARKSLGNVYKSLDTISTTVRDLTTSDLEVIKNEWSTLPIDIGNHIKSMGLHLGDDYASILCYFPPYSRLVAHKHPDSWESVYILSGVATDDINEKSLVEGDTYIIPKDVIHTMTTAEEECYMYIIFSGDERLIKLPNQEIAEAKEVISGLTEPTKF